MFGVGQCNTFSFGIFVKQHAKVVLRRKYKFYSSGAEKD